MAKGYIKWICKVEGKPVPEVAQPTRKDHLCFPGNIYDEDYLRELVDAVLEYGQGNSPTAGGYWGLPDDAIEWDTHPLEHHWARLNDGDPITQEVYECCQWMYQNWDNRFVPEYVNEDYYYEEPVAEEDC